MNAFCERVIGTLRRELLDQLLVLNEAHARRVLDAYAVHYNGHRPHQGRRQLPPLCPGAPDAVDRPDHAPAPSHPSTGRCHQRVQICGLTSGDDFLNGSGRASGAGASGTVLPFPSDEPAVPGQECPGSDCEDLVPAAPGYQAGDCRQPEPVPGLVADRADDLTS
jgi:hypothetical protein